MKTHTPSLSQASSFLASNAALIYNDATEGQFWTKAQNQGAVPQHFGVRFPDGSILEVDPVGCSVSCS